MARVEEDQQDEETVKKDASMVDGRENRMEEIGKKEVGKETKGKR